MSIWDDEGVLLPAEEVKTGMQWLRQGEWVVIATKNHVGFGFVEKILFGWYRRGSVQRRRKEDLELQHSEYKPTTKMRVRKQ